MKIPQLRAIYQKELFTSGAGPTIDGFGVIHDGSFAGVAAFLQTFDGYTQTEKNDITAYTLCFDTGTAPAVGYAITLTAANVTSTSVQTNWATLQSQAGPQSGGPNNIDLIGRGTLNGVLHGLLYQPTSNNYISDAGVLYTQSALQNLVQNGDTLTMMGVYPGTGSAQ
jgi:hypothetical protein